MSSKIGEEKVSMIPRGKLIGMQVYNPNGTFIGTVQDIALPIGGGEMGIQILTRAQSTQTIEWSKIAAVGDIIILKENIELPVSTTAPVVTTPQVVTPIKEEKGRREVITSIFKRKEKPSCPTCGKPLTYIEQYKRWYCYNCSRYV